MSGLFDFLGNTIKNGAPPDPYNNQVPDPTVAPVQKAAFAAQAAAPQYTSVYGTGPGNGMPYSANGQPSYGGYPQGNGLGAVAGRGKPSFFSAQGGAGLALSGLQTIGSLWGSFQQNKLAKQSLNFQKEAFATNTRNSTQQYNTSLEDRVRARYATEGRSGEADGYIERNRLKTP